MVLPFDEVARLAKLRSLNLLDTEPEGEFEDLVKIASAISGCPIALISIVDEHRQWFKAKLGTDACETSREVSFCSVAIQKPEPLVVPDATLDPRFANNPLVTGGLRLRFYCGIPIIVDDLPIGTLCVIDQRPRELTNIQISALEALARQASSLVIARQAAARAEESEARLRAASQASFDALVIFSPIHDETGTIVDFRYSFANDLASQYLGRTYEELHTSTVLDLFPIDHVRRLVKAFSEVLETGIGYEEEIVSVMPGMLGRWVRIQAVRAGNEVAVTSRDIHERHAQAEQLEQQALEMGEVNIQLEMQRFQLEKSRNELEEANAQLRRLATRDGLTGLKNHRAFQEALAEQIVVSARQGRPLSIALLDVDSFKSFNDDFGHQVGDSTLKGVAAALAGSKRSGDLVARYGGEEFVVMMPDTAEAEALIAAERLRRAVEAADWPHRQVTASFGVATLAPDMGREAIVGAADKALYESKRRGKNRVTSFTALEPQSLTELLLSL